MSVKDVRRDLLTRQAFTSTKEHVGSFQGDKDSRLIISGKTQNSCPVPMVILNLLVLGIICTHFFFFTVSH